MSDHANNLNPDGSIDKLLIECLSMEKPKSFFLFAGAGSGKTYSLVETLRGTRDAVGSALRIRNRRIAVITYTKAASEEIQSRLDLDDLFEVSTIHSFMWELLRTFQSDIREWVRDSLQVEIEELESRLSGARSTTTKTYQQNQKKIESKRRRFVALPNISKFSYDPNGENRGRDSLNHSEVLEMGATFIANKELFGLILIRRFPILLIDESQDTNKHLVAALLSLQMKHAGNFSLGLIGDMMQRIYADGEPNLNQIVPPDWEQPIKVMNYRCPKRVVRLINQIRVAIDDIQQQPRRDAEEGTARLFLAKSTATEKERIEQLVTERMAQYSNDPLWKARTADLKILTLEHHMAASRMGFLPFYESLQSIERYRTGLLDGSLPGIGLFMNQLLPLIIAHRTLDEFAKIEVVRRYSPILSRKALLGMNEPKVTWDQIGDGISSILDLWNDDQDPRMIEIVRRISQTNLFEIPPVLEPLIGAPEVPVEDPAEEEDIADDENQAWTAALNNPFSMFERYANYVSGAGRFATHQGVKGLEFDRVMVVIDDTEARGFMFSYEKLFGVKPKSDSDKKNESEGKDTSIDRTTRLFYVTCSRAKKSLAVVAYTDNISSVKDLAISKDWFSEDEIEVVE